MVDPESAIGHIFDPVTGGMAKNPALVSVSAPSAEIADGLSTALCVLPGADHADTLRRFPTARLEYREVLSD